MFALRQQKLGIVSFVRIKNSIPQTKRAHRRSYKKSASCDSILWGIRRGNFGKKAHFKISTETYTRTSEQKQSHCHEDGYSVFRQSNRCASFISATRKGYQNRSVQKRTIQSVKLLLD